MQIRDLPESSAMNKIHTPIAKDLLLAGPSENNLDDAWQRCRVSLRAELGEDIFMSWFGRLALEAIADRKANFTVPTRFLKSWIETHYVDRILAVLNPEFGKLRGLTVEVRSTTHRLAFGGGLMSAGVSPSPGAPRHAELVVDPSLTSEPKPKAARQESKADPVLETLSGSPLDRRLTFATFLVGRSNQLAYNGARRVNEPRSGQAPAFNPLYIYAAVGVGKTHLLQALAHAAASQGSRVVYLTAERFMYGFVAALRAQTAIAFKESLRSIDLLIFDDAQFLQGKSIQTEFCHSLNALVDAGRQVVVVADRPPGELEALEERVRSRLSGGLCVEMKSLDEPLRIKILEARIAAARIIQPGFEVSPAVIAFVARTLRSNGRDLDGAVNRLLAHATLNGTVLSRP